MEVFEVKIWGQSLRPLNIVLLKVYKYKTWTTAFVHIFPTMYRSQKNLSRHKLQPLHCNNRYILITASKLKLKNSISQQPEVGEHSNFGWVSFLWSILSTESSRKSERLTWFQLFSKVAELIWYGMTPLHARLITWLYELMYFSHFLSDSL